MHFAARSLVGESMDEPFTYLRDNVVNGLNLLDACVAGWGRAFHFVLDGQSLRAADWHWLLMRQAPIAPGSPYGESKWALERALHWAVCRPKGLRFASLRYFNAAGASEALGEHHTSGNPSDSLGVAGRSGHREHITIFGDDYDTPDGTCIRDYIHVVDLAEAHVLRH